MGIDLGDRKHEICVLDRQGEVVECKTSGSAARPSEEPGAVIPHAGIFEGGTGDRRPYLNSHDEERVGDRMSLFYKLQYLLGIAPWEGMPSLPIGEQAVALLDRDENDREPPYGRALDLGCGTGFWSVCLAQRGWEVTGIDIVPKALRGARVRASKAGVDVRFIEGSIADLAAAGVGPAFRLILDFGVVHGLPPEQVRAVSSEVTAVSTEDAVLLMYAFSPGRRGPLPRGICREEIEHAYGGWTITDEVAFDLTRAPRFVQKASPSFYCLRRSRL